MATAIKCLSAHCFGFSGLRRKKNLALWYNMYHDTGVTVQYTVIYCFMCMDYLCLHQLCVLTSSHLI